MTTVSILDKICRFDGEPCKENCTFYGETSDENNKIRGTCVFHELWHLHNVERLLAHLPRIEQLLVEIRDTLVKKM